MSHRSSIDIVVTETSLDEVEQIHEDGPDPERLGTKIKKILMWLTRWMVWLQQNSTRRPLTSKHFYGGSFCSKNKQITVLNVVYKSAPKLFLEIQVISRSWVQWTAVSFTWQPLSRKLRTIMIMALVCTWWRQLMETRAICFLCVQLMLKSQEMLLSRMLLQ